MHQNNAPMMQHSLGLLLHYVASLSKVTMEHLGPCKVATTHGMIINLAQLLTRWKVLYVRAFTPGYI